MILTFTTPMPSPHNRGSLKLGLKLREQSPANQEHQRSVRYSCLDFEVCLEDGGPLTMEIISRRGLNAYAVVNWVMTQVPKVLNQAAPLLAVTNFRTFKVCTTVQEDTGAVTILVGVSHPPVAHLLCQEP
jgi:hypothetical protein